MSDWINRNGAVYPYTSRETWRTRGWLLVKKCERANAASANDRRVAAMLLGDSKFAHTDGILRNRLEWIAYGSKESPDVPDGAGA